MTETTFHIETKPISVGYLGKCLEFPSVVVYANTEEKVMEEATKALHGYFEAFPEEKETLDVKQKQIVHLPLEC